MMKTKEYREQLAEAFIHVLEEKQLEWKKEWQAEGARMVPVNGKSGRRYKGINRFFLTLTAMDRGYEDNRWYTFNQVKENNWKLVDAKGQGVKVEYWYPYDKTTKKALPWEEFRKEKLEFGDRYILRASYATVFNASLIEGITPLPKPEIKEISPDKMVERLSKNMGVPIFNDGGDSAFYRPSEDAIHLPLPGYFETDYAYNATALHELAHSTGAAHRLNRDLSGGFGSPAYAYEELIAEISSCFMSQNLQAEQSSFDVENHKAYVQSWIQSIKEKPETLVHAVQQAEKTAAYMEYKAELIEQKEYEQVAASTLNVEPEKIQEPMILNKKQPNDKWHIEQDGKESVLLYGEDVILRGNPEEINEAEERIRYARTDGNKVGAALQKVRLEQGYTAEQMAEIALVSEKELQLIEAGEIYPDRMTLQIISNVCMVYTEELCAGQIVPKKTRKELEVIVREIQDNLQQIKEDTGVLLEFAQKYKIPLPAKEYYVIEDIQTGENLKDGNGNEVRVENKEEAEQIAAEKNEELSRRGAAVREYKQPPIKPEVINQEPKLL